MENTGLRMIRKDLENIPQYELPEGFSLRFYEPGYENAWVDIHKKSDASIEYSVEQFRKEFEGEPELLQRRQFYLCDISQRPIGTATSWFQKDYFGLDYGLVHWVAIEPEYQGKGLAKPLMTAVCMKLRELGHVRSRLATSTARLPAVNLYLKFGFVADVQNETDLAAWHFMMHGLGREHLDCVLVRAIAQSASS